MVLYLTYRFSELGEVLERASFAPNSTHIATVQDNAKRKDCAPEQTHGTTNATANTSHGQKRTSIQCTQPPCLQYLLEGEKKAFTLCQRETPTFKSTMKAPKCKCKFRERTGKKTVALHSLPGSGNTWLRGLLERATGLCTGWPSHC